MKNQTFETRLKYAADGIRSAFTSENSFRFQISAAVLILLFLVITQPEAIWWVTIILSVGSVLSAELINTAIETLVDRLHPDLHPMIKKAKDCAAGAVLVTSLASLGVFIALVVQLINR